MQYGAAINGIRRFANETETGGNRADKAVRKTDASVSMLNRHISGLNGNRFATLSLSALRASSSVDRLRGILLATTTLIGGLGAAFTIRGLQEYSDTWAKTGNRLRIVKKESQALGEVQEKIYDIAQRSRSQYEATAVLFARIAASAKRLNVAQSDTMRVTETIQKSFLVGGATPTEAAQSSIQLSQGIASNRLQGDELRSVLENPALGQLLADQITAGDIGKLRDLAKEGELTAGVIIRAFKNASGEIDRLFAETTQTVGEAFVRLDNAILKSIGQSGKINAGARASVTGINYLADNIDDVIKYTQLLGLALASTFSGKAISGISGYIGQQRVMRAGSLASAQAAAKEAQAIAASTAIKLRDAQGSYAMARATAAAQGAMFAGTNKQVKAGRALQAASLANAQAQRAAAAAGTQLNAVLAAQRGLATTGAVAMRGLSAATSFLGGPAGVALLALGAAFFFVSSKSAQAEEDAARYGDAIKKAADATDDATVSLRQAGRAMEEFNNIATQTERTAAKIEQESKLASYFSEITSTTGVAALALGEHAREMIDLTKKFKAGETGAEDYIDAIDRMASANPDLAPFAEQLIKLARLIGVVQGTVDNLSNSMNNLGSIGKSARPGSFEDKRIPVPTDIKMKLKDDLAEQKGDEIKAANEAGTLSLQQRRLYGLDASDFGSKKKKAGAVKKTGDDRFDNALQELQDRTQALIAEREALNLNYASQLARTERLKIEQDALKAVREEARKKGETDWQNAELSADQVARIDEKVAAYVRESMALKQAVESQEAWTEAAGEAGGILKGLIDGSKDWKDALLDLVPVFIKLANSMNVAGGGKGIFGGGVLQSFIGGLFGISFHGGGTVGSGGRNVQLPTGAPYAGKFHSGGNFGGKAAKHDEVMALVKKKENIFTENQTSGIISALNSNMPADAGRQSNSISVPLHFHLDGAISSADVQNMVRQGASQAVDTVKRSLESWGGELARDGGFS